MKRRILSILLAAALLCALLPAAGLTAGAEIILPPDPFDDVVSGVCGSLTWELNKTNGVLTITGTGEMPDHPWTAYSGSIRTVTVGGGVTNLCDGAFQLCVKLASITLPESLTSIGKSAFSGCTALKDVYYGGTPGQWKAIQIGGDNAALSGAALHTAPCPHMNTHQEHEDAACLTDGYDRTVCDDCGVAVSEAILPARGHELVTDAAVAATCTEPGLTAGEHCMRCDYAVAQEIVPALGHELRTGVVAPTCTERGYTLTACVREGCGYTEKSAWTDALGHNYVNGFCARCGEKDPDAPLSFRDVTEADWYYGAVMFAAENELMNGVGGGRFAPDRPMTRAMLVTVLWRYEGSPAGGFNRFNDVPDDAWFTDAVSWAAENRIVNGVGDGSFEPDTTITREQMAAILFRYAQKKNYDVSARGDLNGFPDARKVQSYAREAIAWAVGAELISGTVLNGKTLLDPQGSATRAQVATILMRFIVNIANK